MDRPLKIGLSKRGSAQGAAVVCESAIATGAQASFAKRRLPVLGVQSVLCVGSGWRALNAGRWHVPSVGAAVAPQGRCPYFF